MIKQVARKSEAATAGLKAFDVILKVGADPITTLADWDRSLRANQGKPVQVTILRDKKQQTLTLQVDSKRHGKLLYEEMFPSDECPLVAELAPEFAQNAAEAAEALRNQMGEIRIDPQQTEELRRQAEKLSESFKAGDFKLDQKQIDQMRQQMEEFQKNLKLKDFKVDPQMMEQFRQRMDEFKQQMEEWNAEGFGAQV
jgi:membrane-associated protease RseP (regulator of RpoE activity)